MTPDAVRRQRFEALAAEVWEPLQRYLRRRADPEVAQDLLADVLLVLWRRLDDVPPDAALPWCYAVARHCLANARRGQERQLRLVRRIAREPVDGGPALADRGLDEALADLRPADREVLRLWAWEGLEAKDLAVVLACTPNAAALRLSRARKALRERLRQSGGPTGHRGRREGEESTA